MTEVQSNTTYFNLITQLILVWWHNLF